MPVFDSHAYLTAASVSSAMRSQEMVLHAMSRFEVDAVALISGLGVSCDFVAGNKQLGEVVNDSLGIFGYVTLNTAFPEASIQEQKRYLNKRHFAASILTGEPHKPVSLKAAREILNAQRRYTKPVAIVARNTGDIHAVQELAEEFDQMKFLILGMGEDNWRYAVEAAKACVNIHLEISGSLDADKVTETANIISARRMLFGSGLPAGNPKLYIEMIRSCPILTTFDKKRILLDNALGLFQIEAEVE